MVTEIVLDVLLSDGTRGMVSNQLGKSVYSHCAGLKLKLKTLKSEKQLKKKKKFVNSADVHTHARYTLSGAIRHSLLNVYLLFILCDALSDARRIKDKNVFTVNTLFKRCSVTLDGQ